MYHDHDTLDGNKTIKCVVEEGQANGSGPCICISLHLSYGVYTNPTDAGSSATNAPPKPTYAMRRHGGRELLRRPRTRHDSHTIVASTRARSRSTNLSIYLTI